jgi:hypothetical protein
LSLEFETLCLEQVWTGLWIDTKIWKIQNIGIIGIYTFSNFFFPRQNQIDSGGIRTRDHKTRIRGSGKFFKIFSKKYFSIKGGSSTWKKYFWHEKKYFWSFWKKWTFWFFPQGRGFESRLEQNFFAQKSPFLCKKIFVGGQGNFFKFVIKTKMIDFGL